MASIEELKEELKTILDDHRYIHSIGVMESCEKLAKNYNLNEDDTERLMKAGLMHDMAKYMSAEESIKYCEENNLKVDYIESVLPGLLHGKIAADMCKKKYGFDDEMCDAIEFHTTGRMNMTIFDKILFCSDKTEERTRDYEDVEHYRATPYRDLDESIIEIIDYILDDAVKNNRPFHALSAETRNYLLLNRQK